MQGFTSGRNVVCVASLRHSTTGQPTGRIYPFSVVIRHFIYVYVGTYMFLHHWAENAIFMHFDF